MAQGFTGTPVFITVREEDNSPLVTDVSTIRVSNGKLTDQGSGEVSLDLSGDVAAFNDLSDVTLTSPATDDFLRFNGSAWINDARQTALDKITDVSGATNEQILTKDTGSGNAIFKDAPAGVSSEAVIKAWVRYDQSSGTPVIRDSFNVASVTDVAVGRATVNWDTDFANADYGYAFGGNSDILFSQSLGTSSMIVNTATDDGTLEDNDNQSVIAIGDQ